MKRSRRTRSSYRGRITNENLRLYGVRDYVVCMVHSIRRENERLVKRVSESPQPNGEQGEPGNGRRYGKSFAHIPWFP